MNTLERPANDIIAKNLDVVQAHFHNENPAGIKAALDLYTDDIVWEVPARGILLRGKEDVLREYTGIFESAEGLEITTIRRFATETMVVDDCFLTFKITGPGWRNCPFEIGTDVNMRLVHIFELRDGKICRENGYEVWRRAADTHLINDDL